MLECESCGANLTLKNETCPYCNAPNPDAIEHVKQLRYYQEKYQKTKSDVVSEAQLKGPLRTRRLIVGTLLFVMIASAIFCFSAYDIRSGIQNSKANSHKHKYIQEAYSYMNEDNALGLHTNSCILSLSYENNLSRITGISNHFVDSQLYLTSLGTANYPYYWKTDTIVDSLASSTNRFIENFNYIMSDEYAMNNEKDDLNVHRSYARNTKKKLDDLYIYYLDMNQEELDSYYKLSVAEMKAYIIQKTNGGTHSDEIR